MALSEPILIARHRSPTPAKMEGEEDDFDVYWNHLVGEHEVWVPFYEDYVQFWKLGNVITEEDGGDWVLDKHCEEYVPIPASTAAWLRTVRKARYGEQEAGKKASMSPETEWGTPPPDEYNAWSESPVAAPTNVSRHTAADSAAAISHNDSNASEYAEDESVVYSSSDDESGAGASDHLQRPRHESEYLGYSDGDGSEYARDARENPGEGVDSGYASDGQDSAEGEYAPRTVTYEFEIKVEEDDDDYALLHPDSPRPDAVVDPITALMRELGLPDDDAPADVNDSA